LSDRSDPAHTFISMTKKFLTLPLLWLAVQPLSAQMPQSYRDEREIGRAFEELELHANAQDRLQTESKRKEGLEEEWLDFRSCLSGLELMNADVERMALDFGGRLSRKPIYDQSLSPDREPFLSSSILYQGLGLVQAHSVEPPS
jgi:hypothetical protein